MPDEGEKILEGGDGGAPVSLAQHLDARGALDLGKALALADQLGEFGDGHVEKHQLIPGTPAHNAVHRQPKDGLEHPHCFLRAWPKDAVYLSQAGNGGVILSDAVEHGLEHHHVLPGGALAQGIAGVGVGHIPDGGIVDQFDVVPVVVAQNGHVVRPLLGHGLAAPLGQAVTGGGGTVAELGRQGLHKAHPADVGGEHVVHQAVDVFKGAPAFDEFLIVLGLTGDVKVIPAAGVELGVHPVEGKGDLGQNVGFQGFL